MYTEFPGYLGSFCKSKIIPKQNWKKKPKGVCVVSRMCFYVLLGRKHNHILYSLNGTNTVRVSKVLIKRKRDVSIHSSVNPKQQKCALHPLPTLGRADDSIIFPTHPHPPPPPSSGQCLLEFSLAQTSCFRAMFRPWLKEDYLHHIGTPMGKRPPLHLTFLYIPHPSNH